MWPFYRAYMSKQNTRKMVEIVMATKLILYTKYIEFNTY